MLANCTRCHKLFNRDPVSRLCLDCRAEEEYDFVKVSQCLSLEHPMSIVEVSEKSGVDKQKILGMFYDGRFALASDRGPRTVTCKRCGFEVIDPDFCLECARRRGDPVELTRIVKIAPMPEFSRKRFREQRRGW